VVRLKGQISMWMLTKMAMMFFIVALALILSGLGSMQGRDICASQARFEAQAITGVLSNVINSPVEDERKLLALDAGLSIGKSDFQRYEIHLLEFVDESKIAASEKGKTVAGLFSVFVRPPAEGEDVSSTRCEANECCGRSSVPFEKFDVRFVGKIKQISEGQVIVFEPSNPASRSKFLVVIKCKEKNPASFPPKSFLFIADCKQDSGEDCFGFASREVNETCGYPTT